MPSQKERNHRRVTGRRVGRNTPIAVEWLEGRALLSQIPLYPMPMPPITTPVNLPTVPTPTNPTNPIPVNATTVPLSTNPAPIAIAKHASSMPKTSAGNHAHHPTQPSGIVTKAPHFYEFYTGPKLAELNAVKASAELSSNGNFTFSGTNQGRINKAPAVYVWGIDRNGNLPPGPFMNRPNIKFDAVVVVTLDSSHMLTAQVMDLSNGVTTALPAGSASIHGSTISVTVPSSLLPSTGLNPSQYRFNYWPEDGGPPISSSVASFAPEFTTAQVGTSQHP